jgi:23S rRNA pseudouridine955/2504/2580 synthase/23S rRNA pseudouridine1911/1915/1917 synthase
MNILFENEKMIAVDKPMGTLVIPDQHTPRAETMVGKASEHMGLKAWVVHRIDRDTTGVLLFAKDAEAHAFLCRQFEKGEVSKSYIALVNGRIDHDEGSIDKSIRIEGREISIAANGKKSLTLYRVLERFSNFTLVEAMPQTGRRHQIRIHFWSIGHPLAVDPEYASRQALFLSDFKKNYKSSGQKQRPLLGRLSLHAASIEFVDPLTKQKITVRTPLPDDFEVTLKQLRKYNAR